MNWGNSHALATAWPGGDVIKNLMLKADRAVEWNALGYKNGEKLF
jgi:hypothetical protein